jgi:hypothetical protein
MRRSTVAGVWSLVTPTSAAPWPCSGTLAANEALDATGAADRAEATLLAGLAAWATLAPGFGVRTRD